MDHLLKIKKKNKIIIANYFLHTWLTLKIKFKKNKMEQRRNIIFKSTNHTAEINIDGLENLVLSKDKFERFPILEKPANYVRGMLRVSFGREVGDDIFAAAFAGEYYIYQDKELTVETNVESLFTNYDYESHKKL